MTALLADDPNRDAYDDLLTAIEASQDQLSLLIAVCDDPQQRQAIVQQYEQDLKPSHHAFRLTLDAGEPSLKTAVRTLLETEPALQRGEPAVITVLGIERLSFLGLGEEKSQQEQFFGYLQWTREALREFRFPIVIWVTYQILSRLSRQSPDFWGWRKGVFRFVSRTRAAIPAAEFQSIRDLGFDQITDETLLPLADLQALIAQTEAQNPKNPLLASLYAQMGQVYYERLDRGEAAEYRVEQAQAVEYFQKAIELQRELGQYLELAGSLSYLALLYRLLGRYADAEPLYVQALEIRRSQLGAAHPHTAQSLNNLAALYESQGRYADTEPLYVQALEIIRSQLGAAHPHTATSLNNLAGLYRSQGRYADAEPLYVQALEIRRSQLGAAHPSTALSLNNLAVLYESQGRYADAEPLYVQALEIRRSQLGAAHPSTALSLHNLAVLYKSQGRYADAEPLLVQALEITRSQLGAAHPSTATSLNNLALLYYSQRRYADAEPLYVQALDVCLQKLGEHHPNTQTVQMNFVGLLRQAMEAGQTGQLSDHPVTQRVLAQLQTERQ